MTGSVPLPLVPLLIALAMVLAYKVGNATSAGASDRHKGKAGLPHVRADFGKKAVRRSARYIRPSVVERRPPPHEVGVLLGFRADGPSWPKLKLHWKLEDSHLVIGPPGEGKTIKLKETIKDWCGPVVATSTKVDIMAHTAWRRRKTHGPVEIFNPEKLGDQHKHGSTLRWNPVEGCKDIQTAIDRAGYLLSGTAAGGGGKSGDREFWSSKANVVLRSYLVAAAYAGVSLVTVKDWTNAPKDRAAIDILIAQSDPELTRLANELSQVLDSYDRFRESVFATLSEVFNFLVTPGAREIVEVTEGDRVFDAERFLREKGTLFCIGAHKDYGSIAPLFCALTGLLYDTAKRLAQSTPGGRLDPPLLFALDEAPNVVPLPLHRMTSEARGLGMTFVICIQDKHQLEDVWGSTRGRIIASNCKVKMFSPSISDEETLKWASSLAGKYKVARITESTNGEGKTTRSTVMEEADVMTGDDIRRMAEFHWLVIVANKRPAVVLVNPFWDRRSVKRAEKKVLRQVTPQPPTSRPPTRGGTPAVPTERVATIIALPSRTGGAPAEAEEQSG